MHEDESAARKKGGLPKGYSATQVPEEVPPEQNLFRHARLSKEARKKGNPARKHRPIDARDTHIDGHDEQQKSRDQKGRENAGQFRRSQAKLAKTGNEGLAQQPAIHGE